MTRSPIKFATGLWPSRLHETFARGPAIAKNRWSAGEEVDLTMVRKSP
jgi:hypothetical protein